MDVKEHVHIGLMLTDTIIVGRSKGPTVLWTEMDIGKMKRKKSPNKGSFFKLVIFATPIMRRGVMNAYPETEGTWFDSMLLFFLSLNNAIRCRWTRFVISTILLIEHIVLL